MAPTPIHIVREDGRVERLGQWRHDSKTLELEGLGFPFLGVGSHQLEGDLPWIFHDMCPSGFLGRVYARRHRLAQDPISWAPAVKLGLISNFGEDLSGNLIVGERALDSFHRRRANFLEEVDEITQLSESFDAELTSTRAEPSSLGGQRPKWVTERFLTKYSPPVDTVAGRRWSDLLRTEYLCSLTLRQNGISTVTAIDEVIVHVDRRLWLKLARFDRTSDGRLGAGSLYYLAMEHFGEAGRSATDILRMLADRGDVDASAVETMSKVDAFSTAIGNNDNHLGNCSLLFNAQGRASLAPIYDVLPMILAPRYDELPDDYLKPRSSPIDARIDSWVHTLVSHVEKDPVISEPFKALWRRYVGA